MGLSGPDPKRVPPKGNLADGDVCGQPADGRTLDFAVDVTGDFLDVNANQKPADRLRRDQDFDAAHTGSPDYQKQAEMYRSLGGDGPFTGDKRGAARRGDQSGRDTGRGDTMDTSTDTNTDR
jgi:hypothetical protein